MFNLWKTSQSQSSFSKVLLGPFFLTIFFSFLVSCDNVRANLSSQEVKISSQFWVWKGSSFLSIASFDGLRRLIEDNNSFSISLADPILWDLFEDNIYWSVAKEGLFYFPSHSPHLVKKEDSNLVKYFYNNKIADNLLKTSDNLLIFFSPRLLEEGEEVFYGLNALSIDREGLVEPFFLPFLKDHLSADLIEVKESSPNHILTEWKEGESIFYLDFNVHSHKEDLISFKKYEDNSKVIPNYDLRASYQEILNRIAYQESLDSFLVEVFNEEQDYTYFIQKGIKDPAEDKIFKGYETSSYLTILTIDRIYDLNKNLSEVKIIELPNLGKLLNYEKVIPSNQSFWLSWYASSLSNTGEKIVGLLRIPYAR